MHFNFVEDILIKDLGEYIPGKFNSVSLNKLKEFITVPYHIDWYKSAKSRKVFPLFLQELSDLNPASFFRTPGILTRNPFFEHAQIKYFVAYSSYATRPRNRTRSRSRYSSRFHSHSAGKPLGRIMAFIDYNYNKQHK